jgi:cysteinyl-tRNA synthetase
MIQFFNTYGRRLEEFRSLNPGEVRMYTCGPTLWNYAHIGNFRTFVFEDFLRRYLEYRGYHVIQVMNLTDVEDRIIKICRDEKIQNFRNFTEKYAEAFFDDLKFLNVKPADHYPRATDNVEEMIAIIERLMQSGHAYRGDDNSVYYKISSFPAYGKLSGLELSELKPGARVRVDDYGKESAEDFALWKAWDENDGNIFWETSLGKGRPGWHIECSAMSMKYLGEEFDIHTGGVDNIFPHHENEIAQSEAVTGKKFVRYWLHADWLLVNGQKMAKRLGNFVTVKELRDRGVSGAALRLSFLSGHYRAQQNFTEQSLSQAMASVERLNGFVSRLQAVLGHSSKSEGELGNEDITQLIRQTRESFVNALDNDLDTPVAIAAVFDFVTKGNKILDSGKYNEKDVKLMRDFMLLDFASTFAVTIDRSEQSEASLPEQVRLLLQQREEARRNKKWKETDELRAKLLELGVRVEDTAHGQKWKLERNL